MNVLRLVGIPILGIQMLGRKPNKEQSSYNISRIITTVLHYDQHKQSIWNSSQNWMNTDD